VACLGPRHIVLSRSNYRSIDPGRNPNNIYGVLYTVYILIQIPAKISEIDLSVVHIHSTTVAWNELNHRSAVPSIPPLFSFFFFLILKEDKRKIGRLNSSVASCNNTAVNEGVFGSLSLLGNENRAPTFFSFYPCLPVSIHTKGNILNWRGYNNNPTNMGVVNKVKIMTTILKSQDSMMEARVRVSSFHFG